MSPVNNSNHDGIWLHMSSNHPSQKINYISLSITNKIGYKVFQAVVFSIFCIFIVPAHAKSSDADNRVLTVASSNNFPPINVLNNEGRLTGFGRDISDAVLQEMGVEVKRQHSGIWSEVLDWLATGQADLIHDTGYTPEREAYMDFTAPIIEMPEVIFVQPNRLNINNFDSLKGLTVACVRNHITHIYLKRFPEINCHLVNKPVEGLYSLIAGDVDAFIYPRDRLWSILLRLYALLKS
ncbi:MAG: transporter substrate-binding domain-containing protein [Gammaproteobacteria bacterium]|nr:transporter substrate-binding domain-containing protein [Gammaproteobacteria bacterium]